MNKIHIELRKIFVNSRVVVCKVWNAYHAHRFIRDGKKNIFTIWNMFDFPVENAQFRRVDLIIR